MVKLVVVAIFTVLIAVPLSGAVGMGISFILSAMRDLKGRRYRRALRAVLLALLFITVGTAPLYWTEWI